MQNAYTNIIFIGLAIFSMLFGAGNLMYPLMVGMTSGPYTTYGMLGFLITAVCLPLLGLVAMVLFDGNYKSFFYRIGKIPGEFLIFASIIIIGPGIALPRITTLSHIMIAPFIPFPLLQTITLASSLIFAIGFLGLTFLLTYKENKIIDILGKYISPLLLLSLIMIIGKGLYTAHDIVPALDTPLSIFTTNLMRGYETLDLIATIFFASVIISLLKNSFGSSQTTHTLALIAGKAGIIGVTLLGCVYIGMSLLGMYHGHNLSHLHAGELFREISFLILGNRGALIISTAVLMACLSTSIALSVVVAEYLKEKLSFMRLSYEYALAITLLASVPLSIFGLGTVLQLTAGPIIYIGYPVVIALTFCNIAYKVWGFSWIKTPVALTFLVATAGYFWYL